MTRSPIELFWTAKKIPVSGRAMVRGKMLHFVAFFVFFDKLIRPHPGPLKGGGQGLSFANFFVPQKIDVYSGTEYKVSEL